MKQFAFVNDAAEREYKDFPKEIQQQFGTSLRAVQDDKKPFLPIQTLEGIGAGVIELKINGSPAFRACLRSFALASLAPQFWGEPD